METQATFGWTSVQSGPHNTLKTRLMKNHSLYRQPLGCRSLTQRLLSERGPSMPRERPAMAPDVERCQDARAVATRCCDLR